MNRRSWEMRGAGYFPRELRSLRYHIKRVDGMSLIPWSKLRERKGDRWVDKLKVFMKRNKKKHHPRGAHFWVIHDFLELG